MLGNPTGSEVGNWFVQHDEHVIPTTSQKLAEGRAKELASLLFGEGNWLWKDRFTIANGDDFEDVIKIINV